MTAPFHGWHWLSIRVVETPFPHVYETYGPGMALLILYALAAILTMVYYFVELYAQSRHRSGVGVLVLAGSILVGASLLILTQLEVLFVPTYEHAPFGISVLAVGTGYAAIRLQFYDVAPIARDRVIKYLKDPFVALDAQQQIVDYNSAFATIVEDFDEHSIGQPLAEVFPKLADQLELSGNEQFTAKMQMDHDGQQYYYDIRGGPIFGFNDEVDGYLIVLRDITALKERERELNLKNERLDRFASVVSHDLRNPLGIAKTYLDFARETCETDDLDTVDESLDRMDAMIGDLLTMARAETSVDDTESIDLAAVAEDAWSTAQTDGATISNEFDETTIEGDRSLIQNVFENLFRNAVDHNGPPVTVRVGLLDGPGFYVEDNGEGIAPDQRADVFEFGHTTSESGTGFGLAIVRELIEAHGWEISVTGSATGGARFEIYTGDQKISADPVSHDANSR